MSCGPGEHWWMVGQEWSGTLSTLPVISIILSWTSKNVQGITPLHLSSAIASQPQYQPATPLLSSRLPLQHSLHSIE